MGLPGIALLIAVLEAKAGKTEIAGIQLGNTEIMAIMGLVLVGVAAIILFVGMAKRNATEMAVTNRRVLIKAGMASRRTLDLMLSRVESIGVEESVWGRMLGYGNVIVHGTGGTPETFLKIAHPQEFRRQVQQQIGTPGMQA
jgi:uncharacterized membrane protein YdbT with pleckstrin-like domain